jgi:RHS repeat-associated protein
MSTTRLRLVAGTSVSALVAGLLYGAVVPAASADEQMSPAAGEVAGIETVGPIATVASSSGERWPTLPTGVAVMPRGTVVNGDFPLVFIPALRTVDAVDVRVRELSSPRPDTSVVDEGSAQRGWFTVGARLATAAEYGVDVRKRSGDWASVGTFNVSATPANAGPSTSAGSVSVSQATGQVSWGWQSRPLPGPAGSVGVGLQWASAATASQGLPEGWRLTVSSGSPWMGLEESPVDAVAVDVPMAPAAKRTSRQRVSVDFAYPRAETRLVTRFVVQGRPAKGRWKTLARMNKSFAKADVDAIVRGRKISRVRIGAVVEGTTIWGPATKVRRNAPPITAAPPQRNLVGAGSGSLATPGDLPSVVRLVGWNGSRLTFVRNPFGVYEQTGGQTPGFANGLAWIKDGEWEFAALDGTVTRFVGGRAVSVTIKGAPASRLDWSGDQLTRVTNEVGHQLTLHYSGDNACPSWSGFADAPAGMLCGVTSPGGDRTQIGYVDAGDSVQISLIKGSDNSGETLGWDDRGRLVAVRSALVSQVGTIDSSVLGVVTAVAYDSDGSASRLTDAPGAVGAPSLTRAIDFPSVTEAQLRAWVDSGDDGSAARSTVKATGGGYALERTTIVDPVTWQTLRVTAPYGLDTFAEIDGRTGQLEKAVDAVGRVTTYTTDDLGQVTSVKGPSTSAAMATENTTDYDTRRTNGQDKPLAGLRAQVYQRDAYAGGVTAEFWESDYSRGGLSGSWSGRGSQFSAQASGAWMPSDVIDAAGAKDGWDFEVSASGGADVTLVVGGVICPASSTVCRVSNLPKGPKAVTIQIADAPSSGWFSVAAAPRGQRPVLIASDEVRPGYGLTTVATTNDDLPGGTNVSRTEYSFAKPALGQMSSVSSPGGLVTRLAYEAAADGDGGWGRLTTRTTPGGLTQTTTYWPDNATVSLPSECGAGAVQVSGQPRTLTRQDGTTVTTFYDIEGRIRAKVTAGGGIEETTCLVYRDDGTLESSTTFIGKESVESVSYIDAVGGDPRVVVETYTRGSAAPSAQGESRTRTVTVDLLGRPVEEVGLAGETTTTTYDAAGQVTRTVVAPPSGSRSESQRFDYAYDTESGLLRSVSVNGVPAAALTREARSGQVTSIDYAGTASVGWGYAPDGRVASVTANAADLRVRDILSMAVGGRITGRSVDVSGAPSGSIDRGYVYDAAGRLSQTTFTGDDSSVFAYSHGAQASSCGSAYAGAGRDGLRTAGSRNGVDYTACYDARGRLVSTTDPLVAGEAGAAELYYDGLGRVERITGPRALAATWLTGTQIARLDEIAPDGSGLISTRWETFGRTVVDKTLVTDEGAATVRYAGVFVLDVADDAVAGTAAIQYSLPGGASVITAPGASATLTIPGTDGAALVRVDVPALGSGSTPPPGAATGVVPGFGPYGEPLVTPRTAGASPVPTYSWQAAAGEETLPGTASVTILGDRPYHPALGAFLAPDPLIDSGDNLYSYTGGDPINSRDVTGQEEFSLAAGLGIVAGAALLATFGGSFLVGRLSLKGNTLGLQLAKTGTYFGIVATSAAAGAATYLAVQGQSADVLITVGAAVGAALVSVGGSVMFAKWGAARATRLAQVRRPGSLEQVKSRALAKLDELHGHAQLDPSLVRDVRSKVEAATTRSDVMKQPIMRVVKREGDFQRKQGDKYLNRISEALTESDYMSAVSNLGD